MEESLHDSQINEWSGIIFTVIAVFLDIFVCHYVHFIALLNRDYCGAKCIQSLFKIDEYPIDELSNSNEEINEEWYNLSYYFKLMFNKLCRPNSCSFCNGILIRFWSFCCGCLAFYCLSIFWFNVLLEYFVISTHFILLFIKDWEAINLFSGIIAYFGLYFIVIIIYWFIKRQCESIIILCRNVCDSLNSRFILIWRTVSFVMCIIFGIISTVYSDTAWIQHVLLYMVISGICWQTIYVVISFGFAVYSIYKTYHFKDTMKLLLIHNDFYINSCIEKKTQKIQKRQKRRIHDDELISPVYNDDNNDNNDNNEATEKSKCPMYCGMACDSFSYRVFMFILLIIYIILSIKNELFRFTLIVMILSWIINIFYKGKYRSLFILWRDVLPPDYFAIISSKKDFKHNSNNNNKPQQKLNKYIELVPETQIDAKEQDEEKKEEETQNIEEKYDDKASTINDIKINYIAFCEEIPSNTYCSCECNPNCCKSENCNLFSQCKTGVIQWTFCLIISIVFIILIVSVLLIKSKSNSYSFENATNIEPYPIIGYDKSLDSMDLVYLTMIAYHNKTEIIDDMKVWFGNDSWNILYVENVSDTKYFHITKDNIHIVSVRGTDDIASFLQDLSLWTEISTFQLFSHFVPLTSMLPMGFIREFIWFSSFPESFIAPSVRKHYDKYIYDYIKESNILNNNDDEYISLFIIGHSLGGGIAQIVASRLTEEYSSSLYNNIISFGLSSPGTLYSSKKFNFKIESLDKTSMSIIPRRDPIPMFDDHGGIIQSIECTKSQTIQCHSKLTSFCEIIQHSNYTDVYGKNIKFANCLCDGGDNTDNWNKCRSQFQ